MKRFLILYFMFWETKNIFEFEFMQNILQNKKVSLESTKIKVKDNEAIKEWNYIRNQEDANEFMKIFMGFHDSTLDKLLYEEEYGKTQLKSFFGQMMS